MSGEADLHEVWRSHKKTRLPRECEGQEVEGIDLMMLDADANACLSDWFATAGAMDDERWQLLEQCIAQVQAVRAGMTGESGDYFARLEGLCAQVLARRSPA